MSNELKKQFEKEENIDKLIGIHGQHFTKLGPDKLNLKEVNYVVNEMKKVPYLRDNGKIHEICCELNFFTRYPVAIQKMMLRRAIIQTIKKGEWIFK
jgi:hypothetical protein